MTASIRRSLPPPLDVVVAEAERAQVLACSWAWQVDAGVACGPGPGPGRVRLEDDGDLGREQRAGAEDLAGQGGVLDGDEVRMGARRTGRGQLEHAGAEGGQDPPGGWTGASSASRASRYATICE